MNVKFEYEHIHQRNVFDLRPYPVQDCKKDLNLFT